MKIYIAADAATRLAKLNNYGAKQTQAKMDDAATKVSKLESAVSQVKSLGPRITELLEVANACVDNDISLFHFDGWDQIHFTADNTGITYGRKPPKYIASKIVSDYAQQHYFFLTDGEECNFYFDANMRGSERHGVVKTIYQIVEGSRGYEEFLAAITDFISGFDKFESDFYAYVDSVVDTDGEV